MDIGYNAYNYKGLQYFFSPKMHVIVIRHHGVYHCSLTTLQNVSYIQKLLVHNILPSRFSLQCYLNRVLESLQSSPEILVILVIGHPCTICAAQTGNRHTPGHFFKRRLLAFVTATAPNLSTTTIDDECRLNSLQTQATQYNNSHHQQHDTNTTSPLQPLTPPRHPHLRLPLRTPRHRLLPPPPNLRLHQRLPLFTLSHHLISPPLLRSMRWIQRVLRRHTWILSGIRLCETWWRLLLLLWCGAFASQCGIWKFGECDVGEC